MLGFDDNPYLDLSREELARLILCLLIEEALSKRLASFREDLPPKPIEGQKELVLRRNDVMLLVHPLR